MKQASSPVGPLAGSQQCSQLVCKLSVPAGKQAGLAAARRASSALRSPPAACLAWMPLPATRTALQQPRRSAWPLLAEDPPSSRSGCTVRAQGMATA
eukprot:CAMPEP_0175729580 /NCGR_PEP_ID=MMETSP0097-20121207/49874_1 /TAXON_ID=311494 /ORGANISM="Alexandrium monilatum, Strain CCMP3105" /LENGTH=96 /DNA_ID=CAMNT_0017037441 /DNA_START=23 /DNA_END=310 /DNA_ORIENTATION=+